MWLFTKYGFFSVVCARRGKGESVKLDQKLLMVRARDRDHIEGLKRRFSRELGSYGIKESPSNDYRFRIFVPRKVWLGVARALAADIDYGNFKSEAARTQGKAGDDYIDVLHTVWSVAYRAQSKKYGPGIYDKPKPGEETGELPFQDDISEEDPDLHEDDVPIMPDDHDTALLVTDGDDGAVVGIVLYPEEYDDASAAYAHAIQEGKLQLVGRPLFEAKEYRDVAHMDCPIFDPYGVMTL
jgi:hypothetical protein